MHFNKNSGILPIAIIFPFFYLAHPHPKTKMLSPTLKFIQFSFLFLSVLFVFVNGEDVKNVGNVQLGVAETNGGALPIEFKEIDDLFNQQSGLNALQKIFSCLRQSTVSKLLFLEENESNSKLLEKIAVDKDEMVLETKLDANHNSSVDKFLNSAPDNISNIIYQCIQQYSPTENKEQCCKANKSIPSVCTQLCSSNAEINEDLTTQCSPHFDGGIAQCYPRSKRSFGEFLCRAVPEPSIHVARAGIGIGALGAATGNPVQAGIGFGVAAGSFIVMGVGAALC